MFLSLYRYSIFKTYVDSIVFELHLPVQPGSISQKVVSLRLIVECYRKCDFQAFDWLIFTLTTDLRLATFL